MKVEYRPEIVISAELKADGIQYFQELIGILRWAYELGHVDIATEISLLSSHLRCLALSWTLTTGISHLWLLEGET